MQPQADFLHPQLQRGQHLAGAGLALAVDQAIVGIALERAVRELPVHPRIERPVQEQVRNHGTDRRSLRGPPVPRPFLAVRHDHRGGQPPFHVKEHPRRQPQRLHGPDDEVPRNAVEELPDVELDCPVVLPAALAGNRERVMRTAPWPVPVGVRVKELLRHPLDPGRGHGLRDAIAHGRHP